LAFLLFAIQIGSACLMSLESMTFRRMSQIVNSAMIGAIYEKSLRLNLKSRQEFSEGKIMNLVNQDVNTIISSIGVVDGVLVLPFQFISTIFLLYNLIGTSCFASIGIMVFIAIYTSIISPNVGKYYSKWIGDADTRIKVLREFLYGIKVVKFRAIEDYFRKRIGDARSTQLHSLKMFNVVLASLQISVGASTMVMVVVSLSVYSYLGNAMNVAVVFPAIMYFDALRTPFNMMTFIVSSAVSGAKSMNRVQEFLCAEELDPSETSVVESELVAIKLKDAESDVNTDTFSLKSLNLEIEKGSLIGIVGAVGAGKSTLLSSLIGETNRMGGEVAVSGKLAYCPQQPWILTGSVEKNILFNQPLDQDRMNEVANVCGLSSDLKVFSDGFKTEIGESGVNVSGGQKSRLGLARALYTLYSGSDIYLLDDPLAALDAHVGKNVFADAIKGYLGDKTVLLVTHQLQFLQQVDKVLVLQDGHISEFGKFDDLVNKPNGTLKKMMESYKLETEEEAESVETTTEESEVVGKKEDAQNFIAAEEKNEGGIKFDVYKRYFAAMGHPFFPFLQIFMTLMMLVVLIIQPFWLVYWSKAQDQATNLYYLYVYAFLGFLYVVAYGSTFALCIYNVYNASVIYHNLAMEGLYRAPLYFFDQNPIGRIINRLSSDVRGLDMVLVSVVLNLSLSFARLTSTLVLASQSSYYILVLFAVLALIYGYVFVYFKASNVELKRLQSIQKSPLDAHINETLSGLASVRAFKQQYQFVQTQRKLMDEYLVSVYMYFSLSVWFSFRMKILSTFVTLFISLVASQSKDLSSDFAAAVGIALTSASGLTSLVSNLLNQLGQAEAEANAVERLDYYAYSLPKEGDLHLDTDPCVEEWPSNGETEIKDLELCYQSRLDFAVIKELSFKMKAGEKVGVVGRTGSGKSTLVSAFFRILEPTKGNIILDGQDISKLGLATLRRRIQMIPQDPVLFQGTFRTNLD
ncbi:P-loop containing nucleoside triphosphate hydrolase protein, partial [Globomyces pollinis-pini]